MKYVSIIKYVLMALSAVLGLMTAMPEYIDLGLRWTYIILGLTVLLAILSPVVNMVQNPKTIVRSLIGVGIVAVVFVVSYLLASGEPIITAANVFDDSLTLKLSDAGLFATYFAMIAAVGSIVVSEIIRVVK